MPKHADRSIGLRTCAAIAAAAMLLSPLRAIAAENDVTLELWPHCAPEDYGESFAGPTPDVEGMTRFVVESCRPFEAKDPLTRQTPVMKPGDTLDVDLVLHNKPGEPVARVRAWLAYDPSVLEGMSVDLGPAFTQPTPGENDFAPEEGYVKIGASSPSEPEEDMLRIARIRFRVKDGAAGNTPIVFYDVTEDPSGHTTVIVGEPDSEDGVLDPPLGTLLVRLPGNSGQGGGVSLPSGQNGGASSAFTGDGQDGNGDGDDTNGDDDDGDDGDGDGDDGSSGQASSSAQGVSSSAAQSSSVFASSSAGANAIGTRFTLLQILNLRATTDGTTVYLAWEALGSPELAGYNVYYGTVSGQYLQRRSLDRDSTTLAVRDLPLGKTYFFAVRGTNAAGDETLFSREVGITVGNPGTSTNPLTAAVLDPGPQGQAPVTDGDLAGETGLSSSLAIFALASAVIGTLLAFRRQLAAAPANAR